MKYLILSLFLGAFIFACNQKKAVTVRSPHAKKQYRYVVYSKSKTSKIEDVKKAIEMHKGKVHKKLKYNKGYVAYLDSTSLPMGNNGLLGPDVVYERDIQFEAISGCQMPQPTDPTLPGEPIEQPKQTIPWGVSEVEAPKAWQVTKGKGVIICSVDTGADIDHKDLAPNIVGGENFVEGVLSYDDDNGHGSHTIGTMVALDNEIGVVGVAPEAKVFAVKVLDSTGLGWSSDIADGIMSCISNGADVINMSLGSSSPSPIIENAVKEAYKSGLIIVAAAGNESTSVGYPARYPEVVAVSSLDSDGLKSYFSNFGPEIAYIAPGGEINSTTPFSNYDVYSGSSMASPHVAAVYALALSVGRKAIKADDMGLWQYYQGKGKPNAYETVK